MNNALAVRILENITNLEKDFDKLIGLDEPRFHILLEAGTVNQVHDDVGLAIVSGASVIDVG